MNQLNIRINYALRTIPLIIYGLLILYSSLLSSFDFWTPMINLSANVVNWFLAGVYNVILVFILLFIRLLIVRFSFEDLNDKIPHTNIWEWIQFYITISFTLLVIFNGLLLTVKIFDNQMFEVIQITLVIIPLIIDLIFHLKWILV